MDSPRKAVFLDRDGTIIVEKGFLSDPDGVEPVPGAAESVKKLNDAGFAVVVVSNQSGVARGYFSEDDVRAVNDRVLEVFSQGGATIDAIYYCPHHMRGVVPRYAIRCSCRKPETGMVQRAIDELGIQPAFVVGDRRVDVELGKNIGVPAILVLTGYGENEPREVLELADLVADDINKAVDWILEHR